LWQVHSLRDVSRWLGCARETQHNDKAAQKDLLGQIVRGCSEHHSTYAQNVTNTDMLQSVKECQRALDVGRDLGDR